MNKLRVIIVGGGLAGLTAAIDLCKRGIEVILFEKDQYPHHKVCGEYLSNEVLPYLKSLGLELGTLNPPGIKRLEFSTRDGKLIECSLDSGGIGISRYSLDHYLYQEALRSGCKIYIESITEIYYKENRFQVGRRGKKNIEAEVVLGAFGKRSTLDKKLERHFLQKTSGWLAVKAHYQNPGYPDDLVSLHNFKGGYCGLSKTETGAVNVCYLASYKSFKKYRDIAHFKHIVLMQNPRLKKFFQSSVPLFEKELSIAQIHFGRKSLVDEHILMIGDAAGLIHPLSGNGMAMAIHSAKLAVDSIVLYQKKSLKDRKELEMDYSQKWKDRFEKRLWSGQILQMILLNKTLANVSQNMIQKFPRLMPYIIQQTHGKPMYV